MFHKLILAAAKLLAYCPLFLLQIMGRSLGLIAYVLDKRMRRHIRNNLRQAAYPFMPWRVAMELGCAACEMLVAWLRSPRHVASLIVEVEGWQHVEARKGKALLWVTPHLGNYDIAGRFVASRMPVLAMYRPPRQAWLEPLMSAGRARGNAEVARADVSGVRLLLKTLKRGGATFILPDQVPSGGDGVWAPFFGRPAYTMTLVPRLALSTGAEVLWFYAERLAWGRGFRVRIEVPSAPFVGIPADDARLMNADIENLIRHSPLQYLWSYNRYKTPAGVLPPSQDTPACE